MSRDSVFSEHAEQDQNLFLWMCSFVLMDMHSVAPEALMFCCVRPHHTRAHTHTHTPHLNIFLPIEASSSKIFQVWNELERKVHVSFHNQCSMIDYNGRDKYKMIRNAMWPVRKNWGRLWNGPKILLGGRNCWVISMENKCCLQHSFLGYPILWGFNAFALFLSL